MRSALRHVPGVECAHTDRAAQTALVECQPDCDREALLAALRRKGIEGEVRADGPAPRP